MSILYLRDKDGKFVPMRTIKGSDGKSAYEQAVEGGYKGSEEAFIALLNGLTAEADADHYADFNNPHKVTAAQVGSLKIYNGFGALNKEIGISFDSDTPIETIIQAMPDNTGLKADINTADVGHSGTTIYPAVYGILSIYKIRDNRVEVEYVSNTATGGKEYNKRWIGQYNSGVFGGFVQVYTEQNKPKASDVEALPIAGGVITGSVLGLGGGLAQVVGGPTFSSISAEAQNSPNTSRLIRAINPDLTSYPLERAAQFIDTKNGVPYEYNLFGEHNVSYFGFSRLYVGSYVGAGVYGPSGETTIPQVLPFKPKFMYVVSAANIKANLFFDLGLGYAITSPGSTTTHQLACRLDGTKPYWYSNSDALNQLNATANTYYFVALG